MRAAIEVTVDFSAMPDHATLAVLADWSHGLNGTFQAVKRVVLPGGNQLKGLVVVVPADFTPGHESPHSVVSNQMPERLRVLSRETSHLRLHSECRNQTHGHGSGACGIRRFGGRLSARKRLIAARVQFAAGQMPCPAKSKRITP